MTDLRNGQDFLKSGVSAATARPLGAGWAAQVAPQPTPVMDQTSHRPWPLPKTSWVIFMRWHDLLFLHWPIRPELIRPMIPSALDLDTFDGWCWIGVVPFHMSGVRPRYVPMPLAFPELNVRTYVKTPGRSGVWFFSLDAASWLTVRAARTWYGLPYYDARMKVRSRADAVDYQSVRAHRGAARAEFGASYRPTATAYQAAPGTLDHWLTERYCLYTAKRDQVVYGDIHHGPWPLQPAELELRTNTMTEQIRIELPDTKPISHFARYQEVVAWPLVPIARE